jgi:hypothetical protein
MYMKLQMKLAGILVVLIMAVMAAAPACADTGQPSLAVSSVTFSPTTFMPGDTGTVTVVITNPSASLTGSSTTQSSTYNYGAGVSNGLTTPSYSTTTSTTSSNTPDGAVNLQNVQLLADSPINVISQSQFLDIGRLGLGQSASFTFTVSVDNGTADGIYPLTLQVRTDNSAIYLNYPITLTVDSSPVNMVVDTAPTSFSTSGSSVSLDLINLRSDQVNGVTVVPIGNGFSFQPQQYIIGSIGSGQMYTVQFTVSALNASNTGSPQFMVVYQNGNNWHQGQPVTVPTTPGTLTQSSTTKGGRGGSVLLVLGLIVLALVIIGAIFVYMRSKRPNR